MRKTANDYLKEFDIIDKKRTALKNRIKDRAEFLCNEFPDIILSHNITANDFINDNRYHSTLSYIHVIDIIEKENLKRLNIKQGNLFED